MRLLSVCRQKDNSPGRKPREQKTFKKILFYEGCTEIAMRVLAAILFDGVRLLGLQRQSRWVKPEDVVVCEGNLTGIAYAEVPCL